MPTARDIVLGVVVPFVAAAALAAVGRLGTSASEGGRDATTVRDFSTVFLT